jgi:hypothetical protein
VRDQDDHSETILFEVPDVALCLDLHARLKDEWDRPTWLAATT